MLLRFRVADLGLVQLRQVVVRLPDIKMVGTEDLLRDRQGAFVERLRFAVAALRLYKNADQLAAYAVSK